MHSKGTVFFGFFFMAMSVQSFNPPPMFITLCRMVIGSGGCLKHIYVATQLNICASLTRSLKKRNKAISEETRGYLHEDGAEAVVVQVEGKEEVGEKEAGAAADIRKRGFKKATKRKE